MTAPAPAPAASSEFPVPASGLHRGWVRVLLAGVGLLPALIAVVQLGRIHPDEVYQLLEPAYWRGCTATGCWRGSGRWGCATGPRRGWPRACSGWPRRWASPTPWRTGRCSPCPRRRCTAGCCGPRTATPSAGRGPGAGSSRCCSWGSTGQCSCSRDAPWASPSPPPSSSWPWRRWSARSVPSARGCWADWRWASRWWRATARRWWWWPRSSGSPGRGAGACSPSRVCRGWGWRWGWGRWMRSPGAGPSTRSPPTWTSTCSRARPRAQFGASPPGFYLVPFLSGVPVWAWAGPGTGRRAAGDAPCPCRCWARGCTCWPSPPPRTRRSASSTRGSSSGWWPPPRCCRRSSSSARAPGAGARRGRWRSPPPSGREPSTRRGI